MKQLLTLLLLAFLHQAWAQNPFPMDSVQYRETIALGSATASELRQKAGTWLTKQGTSSLRVDEASLLVATITGT